MFNITQLRSNTINHIRVFVILFFASDFRESSAHHIEYNIQFITINNTQARDVINIIYLIIHHITISNHDIPLGTIQ